MEILLQAKEAARRVGMPRTTFLAKCEDLGLAPVELPAALKSSKRWLESEIEAFIEARKQERDQALEASRARQRKVLNLVRQRRRA